VAESLAVVTGRNCKEIRARIGVTQDGLAHHARRIGLKWTASAVGDFEAGRSAPALATVILAALALELARQLAVARATIMANTQGRKRQTEITEKPVGVADLLSGSEVVALSDALELPGPVVAAICRGDKYSLRNLLDLAEARTLGGDGAAAVLDQSGLTEDRLAKRLDISREQLGALSFQLWRSTFSEERDGRAGQDANRQKRGRVSRELRAELEEALADGNY
jgi:transcriptional regulator with XRE-family HTH domain